VASGKQSRAGAIGLLFYDQCEHLLTSPTNIISMVPYIRTVINLDREASIAEWVLGGTVPLTDLHRLSSSGRGIKNFLCFYFIFL
jgi:hypothetical protein